MRTLIIIVGLCLLLGTLWDVFETIVLPKRVAANFRFARLFYLSTWKPWRRVGKLIHNDKHRESFLSIYGPLLILALLALWAGLLLLAFGLLHWGASTQLHPREKPHTFFTYLYFSGTTLFPLGMGGLTPADRLGSVLAVVEAATGFGVLALVIGYLPVLFQSVARREANISLLDARASSPPSAAEVLNRYSERMDKLESLFEKWEDWSAELLESHLSYPVLCLYRSQHENQSWIGSLTTMLDTCALVLTAVKNGPKWQAQFTFAMARHALVDLANVFNVTPLMPRRDRLTPNELSTLYDELKRGGVPLSNSSNIQDELNEMRKLYEPYANALAELTLVKLPSWTTPPISVDNWRKSPWQHRAPFAVKHSTTMSDKGSRPLE